MKRVFLFGYYGFGNLGDELYVGYFCNLLKEYFPEREIFILIANHGKNSVLGNARQVDRWNLWRILKMIGPGDLLLGGGGSVFQDLTSKRSLLYYLSLLKMAEGRKAAIILAGHGFGPLSASGRILAGRILRRVQAISCRDRKSAEMLREMRVNQPIIRVGVDPLWDLEITGALPLPLRADPEPKRVAVFFRRGNHNLKKSLLFLLQEEYTEIELFSLAPEDHSFLSRLSVEVGLASVRYVTNATEMLSVCAYRALVIGERLHGLLLAAQAGTPGIGLGADPKLHSFCQEMEWPCLCWEEEDLSSKVLSYARELSAKRREKAEWSVVDEMRQRGKEDRRWLITQISKALG